MKKILLCALSLSLLLSATPRAQAADVASYAKYSLRLPGQLINVAEADLDGDGLGDIVAFCVSPDKRRGPARSVSVFYQRRGAGFSQSPDQSWPLDQSAAAFDIGDVTNTNKKSIIYIAASGLYAYNPSGRAFGTRPVQLVHAESVFSQEDKTDLPHWTLYLGSRGPEPGMLLVPQTERLLVHQAGGSPRQVEALPFATRTDYTESIISGETGPLTVSHKLPVVSAIGYNSRLPLDLFVTWEDDADIFLKKSGAGWNENPIRFRPGLIDENKTELIDTASTQAVDLNGDGRSDLVVTKMSGGVAQAKTLVFIYMRRPDGSFPPKPSQTIITEGVIGPRFIDINGDGRVDLVLPSVRMGINNFINMLTSRQINMSIGIYLQGANGRYPDQPTREKAVSFKLDISSLGKNARPVMAFGKFSRVPGYGLAVASKEDKVYIYAPDRYSLLADNPGARLSVEAPSEMSATDLNGDGLDDLVMSYRRVKDKNRQVEVFLSK